MRVLLATFSIDIAIGINHGAASIAAMLNHHGYEVRHVYVNEKSCGVLKVYIESWKPDVLGISLMEPQAMFVYDFLEDFIVNENRKIPVVIGGPHATMNPEEVLTHEGVNIVVPGEGEFQMTDILARIKTGLYNHHTKLVRDIMPLNDLSKLYPEDLGIFHLDFIIGGKNNMFSANIGRGCIYSCSYCINKSFVRKYNISLKEYIRMKPFFNIYSEIMPYITKDVKFIGFEDDDFMIYDRMMPERLKDFYINYKEFIGMPFSINANLHNVTEDNVKAFKDAGGFVMRIGIESSERLRRKVLNRVMSNDLIRRKLDILKKHDIMISTYNMIGLPYETREDVEEILSLNAEYEASFIKIMTFYPFKGTPIYNICVDNDLIDYNRFKSIVNYDGMSGLKFPQEYHNYLENIRNNFDNILTGYLADKNKKYIKFTCSVAKLVDDV